MPYSFGFSLLMLGFLQSFSSVPWGSSHSEFFAFLAVLVWGWGVASDHSVRLHFTVPVIGLLSIAAIIGIQYINGQIYFLGDAIVLLVYVQLCLIALWVGTYKAKDPNWILTLALILLCAAVGSALIALMQALWVWTETEWILPIRGYRRPGGNFGQANHLATLMVMGAASLIYINQRFKISKIVLVLLCLMLVMGMALAESRTGLLSGITLAIWWFAQDKVLPLQSRLLWTVACAGILISWIWYWPYWITYFHEAGYSVNEARLSHAVGSRWHVWQQLWEAVWMKPWLGWGLRGTSAALAAVVVAGGTTSEPFTYAHNIFLEMAVGIGVPLTLLASMVVVVWGWTRLRSVQTAEAWYAVGLLVPIGVHSMLEYPFAYAYLLVPTMLAIGVIESGNLSSTKSKIDLKIYFGFLGIFSSILIRMVIEYANVEEDFVVARFESLNVGETAKDYRRPNIVLLTQLDALLEVTRMDPSPEMPQSKLLLLREAAIRFPRVSIQSSYAISAALNGNLPEANRQMKVIRAMHGEGAIQNLKIRWDNLVKTQYPQLSVLALPE